MGVKTNRTLFLHGNRSVQCMLCHWRILALDVTYRKNIDTVHIYWTIGQDEYCLFLAVCPGKYYLFFTVGRVKYCILLLLFIAWDKYCLFWTIGWDKYCLFWTIGGDKYCLFWTIGRDKYCLLDYRSRQILSFGL